MSPVAAAVDLVSPLLPGSGDATAAWAADTLAETLADALAGVGAAQALYVATTDGGAREALSFWSEAQQTGLAFANPAAFPYTLATSATGRLSAGLGIHGPCTTYVGPAALDDAEEDARDDLREGLVASALVVSLDGEGPIAPTGGAVRVRLTARLLTADG